MISFAASIALRDKLALFYPDDGSARRIAAEAELNIGRIDFAGSAINRWYTILGEAEKDDKTNNLIEVVVREYPLIRSLCDTYQAMTQEDWQSFDWGNATERYKESLRAQHATIRILGKSDPVPLDGVFTDVYILDEITARRRYDIHELRRKGYNTIELEQLQQTRYEGQELFKKRKNYFILGKPGAGKTTYLRYVTLQAVNGLIDKIPIFLPLHAWSLGQDTSLMPFIDQQFDICGFPNAQTFIEHLLESGQALMLFDGLDEVKLEGDRRRRLTLLLNDFATKYRHTQVLITCRIAASEYQFNGFTDVELADFTPHQVHAYARKWYGVDTVKHNAFINTLYEQRNRGLRELCANPLLLSMLCLAFDRTQHFPERRAELYEDATEALFEKWDSSREIRRDETYHRMSRQQKSRLLAALAAEAFEEGQYFLEQQWLEQRISAHLKNLPGSRIGDGIYGEAVLKTIEAQHGLLVERASDIYAFAHLSFQEYFTSMYIVDNEARGTVKLLIGSHLTDTRWQEVFLLTASMLSNAEDFFDEMQQTLDKMIALCEPIIRLLEWATQRALPNVPFEQPGRRALYIYLICTRSRFHQHARLLDDTTRHSLYPALNFAHALNLRLTDDISHALTLDLTRNLADTRDLDLDLISNLVRARELKLARALAYDLTLGLDLNVASDRARVRSRERNLDREIGTIVQDIGEVQSALLTKYLGATKLLVDCLQVAFVTNRMEIQKNLLLPPILRVSG